MNANSTLALKVEGGGDQVAHVGLHALGSLADRLGLGDALSARIPFTGERLPLHDRGKVLVQSMLMLAGGGECCGDIEYLRSQDELFGAVASDSTTYRTFRHIGPDTLAGLWEGDGRGPGPGVALRRHHGNRHGGARHRRLFFGGDPVRE